MANERVSPFHCPGPEMVNKNLLDNWYFLNPVNQRAGNPIDRWVGTGTINMNGITLSGDGASKYFLQRFESKTLDSIDGLELTASALSSNGNLYSGRHVFTKGAGQFYYLINTYLQIVSTEEGYFELWTNGKYAITIVAAKLELGPVQTLAHLDSTGKWVLNEIPNYVEELNKCRYYYRVFDTEAQRTANNWGMRLANPTAGTISIDGATKYTLDANL